MVVVAEGSVIHSEVVVKVSNITWRALLDTWHRSFYETPVPREKLKIRPLGKNPNGFKQWCTQEIERLSLQVLQAVFCQIVTQKD